jgi:hypothetical protein
MTRYLYLIGFVLAISFGATMGATPIKLVKPKLVVHTDSTVVVLLHFDKAALKNYGAQKEFQYNDSYVGASLWTRFWRWFWSLLDLNRKVIVKILNYLLIGLGAAALIFLILKLAGINILNVIKGRSLTAALPYNESVENIYEIDLDTEIEKAIAQQNYRLAVRLLYLRSLRQLSDADLIKWDINKTNSTYINELTNAEQRIAFNLLTRQFEYIWYGEFIIDAQIFTRISAMFKDFKVKIR